MSDEEGAPLTIDPEPHDPEPADLDAYQLCQQFVREHKDRIDVALATETTVSFYLQEFASLDPEMVLYALQNPGGFFDRIKDGLATCYPDKKVCERAAELVCFVGLGPKTPIRSLRQVHHRRLIAVEGIIKSVSEPRAIVESAAFRCPACHALTMERQTDPFSIVIPDRCSWGGSGLKGECQNKRILIKDFDLWKSVKVDGQYGTVQEFPEGLSGGEQPQSLDFILKHDLVGTLLPGQRVIFNGVVRERLLKKDAPAIGYYLDIHSVETIARDYASLEITAEEEDLFQSWKAEGVLFRRVIDSIAPSIHGLESVKEAIAYMLFGGVSYEEDGIPHRGDIHILLIGDPGTAKSQMLRYAVGISPRGIFTNGKSSTSAGLTATAVPDPVTGKWSLEAGALVIADGGICAVDEVDKMDSEQRSSFHEAMEQQTITITKAGMNTTLHTRCSILGAANPKNGCWDDTADLKQQINLEPTILSRFDLIFLIRDRADRERDAALATHILHQATMQQLKASGEDVPHYRTTALPRDLFRKYVAYCRRTIHPVLSNEARKVLADYFVEFRQQAGTNKPVPITARNLDAMIRICVARARLSMKDEVDGTDAQAVIRLVENCLRDIALDIRTGMIDSTILETGRSLRKSQMLDALVRTIDRLQEENEGAAVHRNLIYAEFPNFPREEVDRLLERLNAEGRIIKPRGENHYRT